MSRWLSRALSGLRAELRQRGQHRAFRIADAEADESLYRQCAQLFAEVRTLAEGARRSPAEPEPGNGALDDTALAEVATELWRAQRKLAQDADGMSRYARQADRYLGACRDKMAEIGLVVQDHDGDQFHPGRTLDVLSYEDDASCDIERVLYTVRPSVYFRDRLIQMGQVVVGVPPSGRPSGSTSDQLGAEHG